MNDDGTETEGFPEPDSPNPFLDGLLRESRESTLTAQAAHLRQVLWDILLATGFDCDGDHRVPPAGVYTPDVPELAMQAVAELRKDYDQALSLIVDPGEVAVPMSDLRAVLTEGTVPPGAITSADRLAAIVAAAGEMP